MTRQAISQHLAVLESAGLVTTERRGRSKFHYFDPAPLSEVTRRWPGTGRTKHRDVPLGEDSWLTVVSPEAPDGPELLLEPAGHPAVTPYRDALVEDGSRSRSSPSRTWKPSTTG